MDPDYNWIPITYFSLKLNTSSVHQSVAQIQDHWESFFPESSFDYFFLDEFFERQYQSDLQYGNTVATFSLLAIIIAILGLFGLTLLNATAKTKEIGIRKVLGASVAHILTLLNVEIIKLILISGILSIPISCFLIVQWLDEYAFRLNLSWWMFVGPVLLVMIVAVCTASYLTFNAAVANPIHSIRDE